MMKKSENDRIFNKSIKLFKKNEALEIVLKYGIFGATWIMLSDYFLEKLAIDFKTYKNLQTYKGWVFILATMLVVYILINRRENRIKRAKNKCLKANKKLKQMAYYDILTGLPNKLMLVKVINRLTDNKHEKFAVALLDIDNFKYINDTLGHYVGDGFLIHISQKLSEKVHAPDVVASLGGDEFAILFKNFESDEALLDKLENIRTEIGNSWNSGSRDFFISTSIGVAKYPDDANEHDTLLKNCGIAMNAAKKEGKNKILFYEKDIYEDTLWYIKMANKIQKGLDNKEFELYYQPQMELSSGKITGLEALVRWYSPDEGFISPGEFIPVAETTGQIYDLERRIVRNVLIQKKKWEEQGIHNIEISINFSNKSLLSNHNFQQLVEIFSEFNLDYSNIIAEITETAAISNIDVAIERLNILKNMGLKIALDDFGTGYSSITYLMRLPIDIIKLDKSYINSRFKNSNDISIVRFIVSLAHDLGFRVIAEGIETKEQLNYLKSINCEYGQGYFIGKPMNVLEINEILNNQLNGNVSELNI